MTARKAAHEYLVRYRWFSVPIPYRSKRPVLDEWQNLRLSVEDIPTYFDGQRQNIGVLLGEPSGGLLDVDLDCKEALHLAPYFLPQTLTFGREGSPRSHWLYVAEPLDALPATTKYQLHRKSKQGKRKAEMLVELRSTGGQTVFPPSVHEEGEPIRWCDKQPALRIDGKELAEAVRRLAVACLFLRHWPRTEGTRQDCALALAGALLRSGMEAEDAERFIYAVAFCAGDEEAENRAKTAAYAAQHKADGSRFWGWPKVAELFGKKPARYARKWLGATDTSQPYARVGDARHTGQDLGEAPALPQRAYALLPNIMREAVSYFDAWHKRDVFLTALLGALSSALPNVRFLYGQQYHSPHLFFFILARAASGKGAMPHAFRWLDAVDEFLQREWLDEREAWQQRIDAYEKAKKSRKESPMDPDPPGPEPPERCLKAGANTTSAALGERLASNQHGVFIGSTEADTLSSSNRREHGNFSHIIRKAFHHDEAQVDRKTESTLRIKHPRLALVLSGTPKQFPRFMEGGVEDGLYSRFGVYSFEAPAVFEPQWATSKDLQLEAFTKRAGQLVLKLYKLLLAREKPLYFDVPAHLRERFTRSFEALHDALAANSAYDLIPTVRRGVVIALRIAAVLTVWRYFEEEKPLGSTQNVLATEADVEAAVALGLVYVEHALREALRMEPEIGRLPDTKGVGGSYRMTGPQRRFFDALPQTFKTAEAESLAEDLDVPRSTMFDWLSRWVEATLLDKPRQGFYEKRWASRDDETPTGLLDSLDFPAESAKKSGSSLDFQSGVQSKIRPGDAPNAESPRIQRSPIPLYVGKRVETSRGPGTVVDIQGERQKVKVRVDALADTPMPVRAFDAADLCPLESAPF